RALSARACQCQDVRTERARFAVRRLVSDRVRQDPVGCAGPPRQLRQRKAQIVRNLADKTSKANYESLLRDCHGRSIAGNGHTSGWKAGVARTRAARRGERQSAGSRSPDAAPEPGHRAAPSQSREARPTASGTLRSGELKLPSVFKAGAV